MNRPSHSPRTKRKSSPFRRKRELVWKKPLDFGRLAQSAKAVEGDLSLRRDLFNHLTTLSLRYFSQQKAGWIIARLTSDVDALSDVLSQGLTTLVVNTLTLLAAIVAVCAYGIVDYQKVLAAVDALKGASAKLLVSGAKIGVLGAS